MNTPKGGQQRAFSFLFYLHFLLLFFEILVKKSSLLIEVNSSMMNTITKPNHWIQRLYTIEKNIFGQDFLAKKFK
jgi:hypothetical protein